MHAEVFWMSLDKFVVLRARVRWCKQDSVYRVHNSNAATVTQLHNALDHAKHYIHHVRCSTERFAPSAATSECSRAAKAALAP